MASVVCRRKNHESYRNCRRIDDLGRVVIPKRDTPDAAPSGRTPLEIFTDREGEIILKKYSPMVETGGIAVQCTRRQWRSLRELMHRGPTRWSRQAGGRKKTFSRKPISRALEHASRADDGAGGKDERAFTPVTDDDSEGITAQVITRFSRR